MSLPFNLFGYDICIFTYMSCSYVYMKGSWAARKIWWIPLIEVAKSHDFTTIKLLSWNYLGWWSKLETLIAIHFISLMLFFEITWDYDTYWPIFRGETVTTGRRKLKLGEVRPRNDHVIQFLDFPVMFDQRLRSWLVWADPFRPLLSGCHALSISPILQLLPMNHSVNSHCSGANM